jgi:hypothetical protein
VDSRALRGGDLPSILNIGHWMRDKPSRFESSAVTLAKGCDGQEGTFPIVDDAEVTSLSSAPATSPI